MQFKFLACIVFVVACFAQAHANPNTNIQLGLVDQLIDQARKAIEVLEKLIGGLIQNAINDLNQFKDQVKQIAEQALETAKNQIKDVIAKAQKEIQDLVDKASEIGADISECLVDNQDRFSDLSENFIANVIECINKEVENAMDIITETVANVQDVYESVQELPGKLQNCGTGISSMPCISQVIADAAQMQLNFPIIIAEKVAEVSQFVTGLKVRLEVCAASQLVTAGVEAAGIVADVTKCSADKAVHH